MKVFQVASEPIINMAFSATHLSDIEKVSIMENRDSYSYVFNNDFFYEWLEDAGRCSIHCLELPNLTSG
mgnify:CR=1 FL=1